MFLFGRLLSNQVTNHGYSVPPTAIGIITIRTITTTCVVSSSFYKKYYFINMTQLNLIDNEIPTQIALSDVFKAYYECRKHKRRTINALAFELNFEREIVKLWREINENKYKIGRSIAFIVKSPVQREVFAANFRDRIVHHLVISKINHLFEQEFVNNSYSCREGKGVLFGVKNIQSQIFDCSNGYTTDCYILKLDIRSFFMSINKHILYQRLYLFLSEKYNKPDKAILLRLIKQIVYHNPQDNCIIKGKRADWNGLPCYKSLFWAEGHCGMPIGNLTSQIFANFYLNSFDKYITETLGFKYYGRYVDDFILIHQNKNVLLNAHTKIKQFLANDLKLRLHPQKVYIQHYTKGVNFIGATIKPYRIYLGKRSKTNMFQKIYNTLPQMAQSIENTFKLLGNFITSINSYIGLMRHYNTYNLRCKIIKKINNTFLGNILEMSGCTTKLELCKMFGKSELKKRQIRKQRYYRYNQIKKRTKEISYGIVQPVANL